MYLLAQLLLTIATVGYSLIPVLADFNATHVTNPTWDPTRVSTSSGRSPAMSASQPSAST